MENQTRRQFVIQTSRVLAFLPFTGIIGCVSGSESGPEESLSRLIYILGPWPVEDNATAENFVNRFLKTGFAQPFLQKSVSLVKSLAGQVSNEKFTAKEIDLRNLSEDHQSLLISLTQQLYSFVEVRFYTINEPPWGQCQGNPKWHMRTPLQQK